MKTEEDNLPSGASRDFDAAVTIQSLPMAPTQMNLAGISVCIVENDPQISQFLSDWIRTADGFCLLSYHSTAETALTAVPHERPAVVLVDVSLPGLSALNCIRQLKPILPQTQFVVLVSEQDSECIFSALAAGASGYLLKQTSRNELLAGLRHVYAGGSPINAELSQRLLHFFHLQSSPQTQAAAEPSPRENHLLRFLAAGFSLDEVADKLRISPAMVSTYIRSIYEKLHFQAGAGILP
jgi:DNA-binding NarL/FixJ family response regulator